MRASPPPPLCLRSSFLDVDTEETRQCHRARLPVLSPPLLSPVTEEGSEGEYKDGEDLLGAKSMTVQEQLRPISAYSTVSSLLHLLPTLELFPIPPNLSRDISQDLAGSDDDNDDKVSLFSFAHPRQAPIPPIPSQSLSLVTESSPVTPDMLTPNSSFPPGRELGDESDKHEDEFDWRQAIDSFSQDFDINLEPHVNDETDADERYLLPFSKGPEWTIPSSSSSRLNDKLPPKSILKNSSGKHLRTPSYPPPSTPLPMVPSTPLPRTEMLEFSIPPAPASRTTPRKPPTPPRGASGNISTHKSESPLAYLYPTRKYTGSHYAVYQREPSSPAPEPTLASAFASPSAHIFSLPKPRARSASSSSSASVSPAPSSSGSTFSSPSPSYSSLPFSPPPNSSHHSHRHIRRSPSTSSSASGSSRAGSTTSSSGSSVGSRSSGTSSRSSKSGMLPTRGAIPIELLIRS